MASFPAATGRRSLADEPPCSLAAERSLDERLKRRIIQSVLPRLAERILATRRGSRSAAVQASTLEHVFDASIGLVMRLLVALCADARGLAGKSNRFEQVWFTGGGPAGQPLKALKLAIDYRLLDVRTIGSVYETLLEYKLVQDSGQPSGRRNSGGQGLRLVRDRQRRKATGSFYTPARVIEHVVEHSVGAVLDRKLESLGPELEVAARDWVAKSGAACASQQRLFERLFEIRVLDPAMGSGHFLLAAASCMIDRLAKLLAEFPAGFVQWLFGRTAARRASAARPAPIHHELLRPYVLERCIYGVDIDPVAVELAKATLWLDGGSAGAAATVAKPVRRNGRAEQRQLRLNLRCGNALLGTGWLELPAEVRAGLCRSQTGVPPGNRLAMLRDAMDRLLANRLGVERAEATQPDLRFFHWELEFPEVFFEIGSGDSACLRHKNDIVPGSAGFDAVIGNPPYVDSETMTRHHARLRQACAKRLAACRGNWDLFCAFIERGLSLVNDGGRWSQIVPNKLLAADYSIAIQNEIAQHTLLAIRDYSHAPVFTDAGVYPIVPLIAKTSEPAAIQIEIMGGSAPGDLHVSRRWTARGERLAKLPAGCWSPIVNPDWDLLDRILGNSTTLDAAGFEICGAATVAEAYQIAGILHDSSDRLPAADELPLLNSGTIDPFCPLWGQRPTRYLGSCYNRPVVRRAELERLLPVRAQQALAAKAIVAGMTRRIEAVYDPGGYLAGKSTTIIRHPQPIAIELLVAILNSAVTAFAFRRLFESLALAGGYLRVGPPQLRRALVPSGLLPAVGMLHDAGPTSEPSRRTLRQPTTFLEACRRILAAARRAGQEGKPGDGAEIDTCAGMLFGLDPDQIAAVGAWSERGEFQQPVIGSSVNGNTISTAAGPVATNRAGSSATSAARRINRSSGRPK